MKWVRRLVSLVILLALLAGVAKTQLGGGSGKKVGRKVVKVGHAQVTIPANTTKDPLSVMQALLKKTAYLPAYQECILRQTEELATTRELEQLIRLRPAQRIRAEAALFERVLPRCYRPGRLIVNPRATHSALLPIREQTAEVVKALIAKGRLSGSEERCVVRQFRAMPDVTLIRMANSAPAERAALVGRLVVPCGVTVR